MRVCEITPATPSGIHRAVGILRSGGVIALPTETVYGLGGDAGNRLAIQAIYTTKGRPSHNPLIVHIGDMAILQRYAVLNAMAARLADAFWPGPLTLVLSRCVGCMATPEVSAGGQTIALRMPAHPVAQAVLRAFGQGVAAPSANRSGKISPTTAQHVADEFAATDVAPALILDGGATKVGLESTVVDCTGETPVILRAGSVTQEQIADVLGQATADTTASEDIMLKSPGLLASHYAPDAQLRLNATDWREGEALLAFGPPLEGEHGPCEQLSMDANLEEAAHHLYDALRRLDAQGCARIAVMPIPLRGVGVAINDRLQRAAAPRDCKEG